MHINMLVQLKSRLIKFLKVELTHPDNVIESIYSCMFTPLSDSDWPQRSEQDQ